jgi:RNA polymerase sigma factor (sigma-70 family)
MRKALQNGGVIRLPSSAKPEAVKKFQRSVYLEDASIAAAVGLQSSPGAGGNGNEPACIMSSVADENDLADVQLENLQDDQLLVELLAKLNESDPRKFDILVSRFYGERTLAEIGAEYGISREWARRINDEAIKDLKEFAKGKS